MKTKNITMILILSFFISSQQCLSMDYMNNSYNSLTTILQNNMIKAREWTNNLYNSYQEFGTLATLSATLGMYDFKRITGLDENRLTTYNSNELQKAIDRVKRMIEYRGWSEKLGQFVNKLENRRNQVASDEEFAARSTANGSFL